MSPSCVDLAGELDLDCVRLIDRVSQFADLLFECLGGCVALRQLGLKQFDAVIDVGDLELDCFQFRPTRKQAHGGRQRSGAECAVGFDHFAGFGDASGSLTGPDC